MSRNTSIKLTGKASRSTTYSCNDGFRVRQLRTLTEVSKTQGIIMVISVRLDSNIAAKLAQQAALLGMTKSDFIDDALARALGMKNPATLLKQTRSGGKMGRPNASSTVSAAMRGKLLARRSD